MARRIHVVRGLSSGFAELWARTKPHFADPCDSSLSLYHENLFGLSLPRALQSCECHEPRAEGTDWAVTFAVLAECGTDVESHTQKGLNQNLINTFILFSNLCSLFHI